MGADLSLLVGKLYKNSIPVRGLAHPVVFQGGKAFGSGRKLRKNRHLQRVPGLEEFTSSPRNPDIQNIDNFEKFGAVMVTPRNCVNLRGVLIHQVRERVFRVLTSH